jgi:hypothetical protein
MCVRVLVENGIDGEEERVIEAIEARSDELQHGRSPDRLAGSGDLEEKDAGRAHDNGGHHSPPFVSDSTGKCPHSSGATVDVAPLGHGGRARHPVVL